MALFDLHTAIDAIAVGLQQDLKSLPAEFCGTFQYTTTGKNLTHPVILGALTHHLRRLPGVRHVGVDVRFNRPNERVKFQPDLVAFSDDALEKPVLIIDYESPNSSDLRLIEKDLKAYQRWRGNEASASAYIVLTTLPACEAKGWELRWTYKDGYNSELRGKESELSANPLQFWRKQWSERISAEMLKGVVLMNIDRQSVSVLSLDKEHAAANDHI